VTTPQRFRDTAAAIRKDVSRRLWRYREDALLTQVADYLDAAATQLDLSAGEGVDPPPMLFARRFADAWDTP
jgi:hypothetical protein